MSRPDNYIHITKNVTPQVYVEALEYVYKCFPSKDCYQCPFSINYSRSTIKKFQKDGVHWWCAVLEKWVIKRSCTKELILKRMLEVL